MAPLSQLQLSLFKCVKDGNVAEFKRLTKKYDNETLKARDEYGQTLLHVACDQDQLEIVKHIIEKMKANINVPDKNSWTPLHCATKENRLEVADYLLEKGADAGALTNDRDTPLHYFVRCSYDKPGLYEKIFEVLLLRGCDIDKQNSHGESALHLAAFRGREKCVSLLLEKHAKPNSKNKFGETPIHLAARSGFKSIVQELLTYGADATIVGSQGTPEQVATQAGQTEIAKLLLDHVVKLAQRGSSDSKAMSESTRRMFDVVKKGNLQELKQFLIDFKSKVNVNERDDTGRTLLHIAAEEGHLSTVLHLVDKLKIDVNAQDKNGWTALHCACYEGKLDVVEFLLRRGGAAGAITANHNTPLHYFARVACTAGSSELYHRVLKRLVEGGCEVNQQNVLGESALHLASFRARKECVAFLLGNDAQTNLRNKLGETCLHVACRTGDLDIIEMLLSHGADTTISGKDGTPEDIARTMKFHKVVTYLQTRNQLYPVTKGPAKVRDALWEAIAAAATDGDIKEFRRLLALKRKRDPEFLIDTKDLDGRTFAHVAASAGRLVILKYLGETEKANMTVKDSRGLIPLHDACENGNVMTIKYLLRKGEKANVVTNGHDTPLLYFVRGFHPFEVFTEVVKLLLDASCEIDTQNIDGNTALHIILKMQQKDEAMFLLTNGASTNIMDKHGEASLHLAAKIGDIELANKLLECGADVSIQSPKGTAEQIANSRGFPDLAKLFAAKLLSMAQKNVVQQAPKILKTQPVIDLSFHKAVKNNNLAELQNLLRKRDDFQIESKDVAGQTILHVACEEGNLDMVMFLVDKLKANVNAKDKEDWTPLHIACHRGALEVADFLLDRGANVVATTNDQNSVLHYFVRIPMTKPQLYEKILNRLLNEGCPINLQNTNGETALHAACLRNQEKCVVYLLKRDAQPSFANKFGETPLHQAIRGGNKEIVSILLEVGADVTAKVGGKTPIEIAQDNKKTEIVKLIQEFKERQANDNTPEEDKVLVWIYWHDGKGGTIPLKISKYTSLLNVAERLPLPDSVRSQVMFTYGGRVLDPTVPDTPSVKVTTGPNNFAPNNLEINEKCPFVTFATEFSKISDEKLKERLQISLDGNAVKLGNECVLKFLKFYRLSDDKSTNTPDPLGEIEPFKTSGLKGVPPQLAKVGGLILPLFQSEAMWLYFNAIEPHAIQITFDNVNACANVPVNNKRLNSDVQDYITVPRQRLMTGVTHDGNCVRQFTALAKDETTKWAVMTIKAIPMCPHDVEFMQRPAGKSNVYNFYTSPQALNLKPNDYVYMKSKRFQHRPSQLADFDLPRHGELKVDATKSMNSISKSQTYDINIRNMALGQLQKLTVTSDMTVDRLRKQIMKLYLTSGSEITDVKLGSATLYDENKTLADCGVKEGSSIDVVTSPSNISIREALKEVGPTVGGRKGQTIFNDARHYRAWDTRRGVRLFVHIVNTTTFQKLMGQSLSRPPIYRVAYELSKIPWKKEFAENPDAEPDVSMMAGARPVQRETYDYKRFVF